MKHILTAALVAVSIFSYSQETKKAPAKPAKHNAKVVNEKDLVCGMNVDKSMKDTFTYNKKVYRFCGTHCKETFKKDPKKYVKK